MTEIQHLTSQLTHVRQRIHDACRRAGRDPSEVHLVAVTKNVDTPVVEALVELGVVDLGENRPQELWRKTSIVADASLRWHLIGHLQRNKIERTLPLIHSIHSVDSERLLDALEREAKRLGRRVPIFLEVNASGEENKHGFAPTEVVPLAARLEQLTHLQVQGLMTMAAYEADAELCRPTFATTRRLRDELRQTLGDKHPLDSLSMGMSNDFEVAIEEGATHIRLGSVLYEGLDGEE